MKKIFTLFAAVLLTATLWAQSPQKLSYQAIIRDNSGALVTNHAIGMKISILQGSATNNTAAYSEIQTPTTNANGLVSIEIGGTGFDAVDWSNGPYFIKTETDPTGGENYTITGTSQLLSVPYALYAAKSGSSDYTETDPVFTGSAAKNVTSNSISNWNTAFGWGNHAGLYRPIEYVPSWTEVTAKPTTLTGYGITDAMSTTHIANTITVTNIANWNTAFGWGNHAGLYRPISYVPLWGEIIGRPTTLAGYAITDAMSTTHAANAITATNITNWNAAYGWGNHAGLYRPINYVPAWADITSKPTTLAGFGITNGMSTAHPANAITATNITNWNTAFGWGNHAGLYRPISYVPAWTEVTGKPTFATVATTGSYNDLLNKPAPYTAGAGILFTGSTISANLSLQVSATGDILTLTPGNSVYVPGISNANSPIPIVTSKVVTNITSTKAYGSGNVVFYGTTAVTETGMCWSLNQPPTVADNHVVSGVYDGDFICQMTGLAANTVYFARAYAKTGTSTYNYGQTVIFTTTDILPIPIVTTTEVTSITETGALSGGFISADGGSAVTARGVCWSTSTGPTTALTTKTSNGTGTGIYTGVLSGLTLNTQYYVRAFATNANGTNYGPELFFKTAGVSPTVTTTTPAAVTAGTAILGGYVTVQGSASVTDRGICFSTTLNPSISDIKVAVGSGIGSFNSSDARLKPNTLYHVRAYATNSIGTAYGQDQTFTTLDAYYESFESNFPGGITGAWGIRTGDVAEGYFSLQTLQNGAVASLTRTLLNSGQILYWSKNNYTSSITFSIDDIDQVTTNDVNWLQKSFPVSAGLHTFKWKFTSGNGNGWVDYIIMPQ